MAMKTPGVYIVEKNAFPNSVVEVATAVPAFIGYTQRADNGGNDLTRKPWRIASMAEFERYFGGAPEPVFKIRRVPDPKDLAAARDAAGKAAKAAKDALDKAQKDATAKQKAFAESAESKALADAVTKAAAAEATDAEKAAVKGAQEALDKSTAATELKAARDGLATATATEFSKRMAAQLLGSADDDTVEPAGMDKARAQLTEFKLKEKTYQLTRASGADGHRFLLHQAMRHFFQNGGGPCYIVSVGRYAGKTIEAGDDNKGLLSGLPPLIKEQEPTMVLVPDAVLLPRNDCVSVQTAVLKHCGLDMKSRVAILDVWGGELDRQDKAGSCIDQFRNDIGINFLDYAAAYYPWLHTSLQQAGDFRYWMVDSANDLAAVIWDELQLDGADASDKRTQERKAALLDLTKTTDDWVASITQVIDNGTGTPDQKAKAKKRLEDPELRRDDIDINRRLLDKSLLTMSALYTKIRDEALVQMNLMPPSAAMAGLYTMVDNTRGVWKAPANVSVAGVVKPAVEISHADQEDLNVTTQGKSINAIRSFIGEGALVWGARTLDGNSLDWRYVNVRRTMIMLEESCRLASKAMVFEPNVANTWVTIKSMISNFLTGIWKRGGLAGAVPDDAFSVHVGLGETMTPEDILEGILRVTVLVAISRPAEFIEITFQQQMQKS
jgi:uncharacterized protein